VSDRSGNKVVSARHERQAAPARPRATMFINPDGCVMLLEA